MEKTGTDLEADRENEQDEAEFLDKMKDFRIGPETEMADQDADEQDPGGSQ